MKVWSWKSDSLESQPEEAENPDTFTQGVQGICPTGWHIPTDIEWSALTTFLSWESQAGAKMKETGTTHWVTPNVATNSSGFTARPGGAREMAITFYDLHYMALFWSSTQSDNMYKWCRTLIYYSVAVTRTPDPKVFGYSVRCLKN